MPTNEQDPIYRLDFDNKHKQKLATFLRIARSHTRDIEMLPALADLEKYIDSHIYKVVKELVGDPEEVKQSRKWNGPQDCEELIARNQFRKKLLTKAAKQLGVEE